MRGASVIVGFLLVLIAPSGVDARQTQNDLPTIQGPPPPAPPAVVARDQAGRVTVRAVRLDEPLSVDGALDEAVYGNVPSMSDFIQQEPREGQPATERTEAWIFFDNRNLYISARCWDSRPDRLVANEMRRDNFNIFQNDNFTVILDTFYARRSGWFFQTNALGAIRDQEVTNERDNNNDWNTVWDARSTRFSDGWAVEIVIPFKSLRYRRSGPQIWGINLRRVIRWKNEHSFLSPIPASYGVRGIYKLSSAATLVGVETPERSMNLELKPYGITSLTTNRMAAVPFSNRGSGDAGFDVKYGLTRGLTADFTYNTDFAQVEEDDQQVNLTRFSLFFPEKRDFFLEGQGIFTFGGAQTQASASGGTTLRSNPESSTPIVFYSRRIGLSQGLAVPIVAGGRLTGKMDKYEIGALDIYTDDSDAARAVATNFSVIRIRRDILRRSTIGLIATRRSSSISTDGANTAAGVDANLAFFQDLIVRGYYAATDTPGRSSTGASKASYRGLFEYAADRYGLQVEHLSVGKDFNPEIGFLRREAFKRTFAEARFSPRPQSIASVRKFSWEASVDYITDPGGRLETRQAQGTFRSEFSNSDQLAIDYTRNLEVFTRNEVVSGATIPPGSYSFQDVRARYELGPQRRVIGLATLGYGGFYDGDRTEAGYRGRVELTRHVAVEPGISINWIDLPTTRFTARLYSARGIVALSPRLFISSFVQYNSTNATVGSSVRLRWEYRPLSNLFVVYSDGHDTSARNVTRLQNRTFAVKLTRLFRF